MGGFRIGNRLPIRDGAVRPEVGLRASGGGLGIFGDQFQIVHIQFHSEPGPVVGKQLAVFKVKANGDMR